MENKLVQFISWKDGTVYRTLKGQKEGIYALDVGLHNKIYCGGKESAIFIFT